MKMHSDTGCRNCPTLSVIKVGPRALVCISPHSVFPKLSAVVAPHVAATESVAAETGDCPQSQVLAAAIISATDEGDCSGTESPALSDRLEIFDLESVLSGTPGACSSEREDVGASNFSSGDDLGNLEPGSITWGGRIATPAPSGRARNRAVSPIVSRYPSPDALCIGCDAPADGFFCEACAADAAGIVAEWDDGGLEEFVSALEENWLRAQGSCGVAESRSEVEFSPAGSKWPTVKMAGCDRTGNWEAGLAPGPQDSNPDPASAPPEPRITTESLDASGDSVLPFIDIPKFLPHRSEASS